MQSLKKVPSPVFQSAEIINQNHSLENLNSTQKKVKKWKSDYNLSRKYNYNWENGREWLNQTEDGKCFCSLCNCSFKPKKSSLSQHEQTSKHEKALINSTDNAIDSKAKIKKIKTAIERKEENIIENEKILENLTRHIDASAGNEKVREQICTADGSFIIVESDRALFKPKETGIVDLSKLSEDVAKVFKSDLENYLKKNESLILSLNNNQSLANEENGLIPLTKMLVGHMANHYLTEYSIDSWKSNPSQVSNSSVATKLSSLQEMMEKSAKELRCIKQQLETNQEFSSSGITLDRILNISI